MFDKHFVGLDVTGIQNNGEQLPVSRVTLLLDDENAVTAGDDTGLEITASCPHATQAIVNVLLSQVKGYQYRMFQADDARLDPAAELGDGITAGGIYSVISRMDDDGTGFPGVTAPGEAELEDEYPSGGFMTQEFNRKLAQTRSQIIKTAESITLQVEGNEKSIQATLDLIDGFTVTDSSGTTKIKGSSLETGSIAANSISADKLNLTGQITFSDLNSATQSTINSASSNANSALTAANNANNTVSGWVYPGTTMINGNMLMTGTVQASVLKGGRVDLLSSENFTVGSLEITKPYSNIRGLLSIAAEDLKIASNFNIEIKAGETGFTFFPYPVNQIYATGEVAIEGNLFPPRGYTYSLGAGHIPWSDLYVSNDPIITSDREKKKDINYDLSPYDALFDALRPVSYRLVDGESGRTHLGLIAQDVEQAMADCGLTDMDFAGLIRSPREEGGYDYALRYGEFIPMCIAKLQALEARMAELERRIAL